MQLGRVAPAGLTEDPLDDLPINTAINVGPPPKKKKLDSLICLPQTDCNIKSEELADATRFSDRRRKRDEGCFVLLIESTKLLGKVLKYASKQNDGFVNQTVHSYEDMLQLDTTLKSLIYASEQEASKWDVDIHNQLTICYRQVATDPLLYFH